MYSASGRDAGQPPSAVATPRSPGASSSSSADEKRKKKGGVNVEGTTWRIDPARRRPRTERAARAAEMERWKAGEGDGGGAGGARQAGHRTEGEGVREPGFEDEGLARTAWREVADRSSVAPPPVTAAAAAAATVAGSAAGSLQSAATPRVTMNPPQSVGWAEKMRGTAAAGLYNAGRRTEDAMSDLGSGAGGGPSAAASASLYSSVAPSDEGAVYPPPGGASRSSGGTGRSSVEAPSDEYGGGYPMEPDHTSGYSGRLTEDGGSEMTGSAASTWVHGTGTRESSNAAVVDGVRRPEDERGGPGGAGGNGSMGLQLPTYVSRSSLQGPSGGVGVGVGGGDATPAAMPDLNGRPSISDHPPLPTPVASSMTVEARADVVSAAPKKWYQKRRNQVAILLVALLVAAGGITAGVLLSGVADGGGDTTSDVAGGDESDSTTTTTTTTPTEEEPGIDITTPPTNAEMAAAERDLTELICEAFQPSCPFLEDDISFSTQRRAVQWLSSHPPGLLSEVYSSDYSKLARYSLAVLYLSTTFRDVGGGGGSDGRQGREGWMVAATDVCEWEGVGCSDDGMVEVLDMGWFLEEGTVPAELAVLKEGLKELYLQNNNLDGALPVQLSQLSNLEVLALDENELDGNLPLELGELSNLQTFKVNKNQLTGSVPAEVCALTSTGVLRTLWADCTGKNGGRLKCDCCSYCCDQQECCPPQDNEVKTNCVFYTS